MKKIIIIIIVLIVLVALGIGAWFYIDAEETKRLDAESVTLKEDLTIEFGKEAKVSDFLANLNGQLVSDNSIDTEKLGYLNVPFEYINIKNKKRKAEYTIKVIDVNAPKIFSGNSYSVTVGYKKDLTDVLLSGDDIDDNPTREILGEYDFDTVGSYDLTYVVTDSSGNQTKKPFTLYVKEKSNEQVPPKETEPLYISEVLENHKTSKTKIGIDVSKWQGEIDWQAVKASGVEFVMIRMGYQTDYDGECKVDPYFVANITGAKEAGLPVGLYFYSYAKNVNQAREQAEWVKDNISEYEIDLPIAFDWESWSSFNTTGMSFYTINKAANTFLDTLKEAGYEGMLYSSKNYLEKIWYPTKYETWLAQYNTKATYDGEYSIWQMSDSGRVDGIKGNVDVDIMYLDKRQ
ncbi:MAG: hypothetical protein HFJ51_06790 [Clostridia bacterium]|nr:hypothetical protein [Clostridia bacterium]